MMFVKALWWKLRISTTQTTVPKAGNRICDSVIQIQHPPEFTGHSCGTLPGCTAADVSIPPACRTQIPPKSQAWHQWIFLWFCEGGSIIKMFMHLIRFTLNVWILQYCLQNSTWTLRSRLSVDWVSNFPEVTCWLMPCCALHLRGSRATGSPGSNSISILAPRMITLLSSSSPGTALYVWNKTLKVWMWQFSEGRKMTFKYLNLRINKTFDDYTSSPYCVSLYFLVSWATHPHSKLFSIIPQSDLKKE